MAMVRLTSTPGKYRRSVASISEPLIHGGLGFGPFCASLMGSALAWVLAISSTLLLPRNCFANGYPIGLEFCGLLCAMPRCRFGMLGSPGVVVQHMEDYGGKST